MSVTVPTTEPESVVAGDTWTWKRLLADYPAGTYTLKYRLINAVGRSTLLPEHREPITL